MEAYIFPEGLDEKRLAIAKRMAYFCSTADMADVLRLNDIVQTTISIRAADAAKEQTDKAG